MSLLTKLMKPWDRGLTVYQGFMLTMSLSSTDVMPLVFIGLLTLDVYLRGDS